MSAKILDLYKYLKENKFYHEAKIAASLIVNKIASASRPIVFIDLDETLIANFKEPKEEMVRTLNLRESWDIEDAEEDGLSQEEIIEIKNRYEKYKKQLNEDLIKENEKRNIMIRPLFVNLMNEVSKFADIYVLTGSARTRANYIKDIFPENINSLIKGWFSSRIKEDFLFDSSLVGRPYVLVDDNIINSSGNQTKHKIIRGKVPEEIEASEENLNVNDFHVKITAFFDMEDQEFDYERVLSEIKEKLKKQGVEV